MAGRKDIIIYQGATFILPLTITDGDGVVYPLTGYTPRAQIRRTHRSPDIIATFTCTVNIPLGQITITLSSVITAAIIAGETVTDSRSKYVWDLEIYTTGATPTVIRLLEGYAYISPEVTRPTV